MNTISFTKGNNVIKRGDNVTPLSIKLIPVHEIDKTNITVRLSNSLGYLMDLEKVSINEDKTLSIVLTDKETEQLPSGIYGLEVWVSKDDTDIIYPSDGQGMFRLTNNSLDVTGVTIPEITLQQFVDRYDELEKETTEIVTESKETVTKITTNAIMKIVETVSNAKNNINQVVSKGTTEIKDISEEAKLAIEKEIESMLQVISDNQVVKHTDAVNWQKYQITEDRGSSLSVIGYDLLSTDDIKNFDGYVAIVKNAPNGVADRGHLKRTYYSKSITSTYTPYNENSIYTNVHDFSRKIWLGWEKFVTASEIATIQKRKITADNGAPVYDLNATKDIFSEAISWGNGFHTFYLSAGAVNNPAGTSSYVMGFAQFYGNAGGIKAYDKLGRSYYAPRLGVKFGKWSEFVATDTDDIE